MAKNAPQALSEAQQEIMEIIWDRGEVSVSDVWDVLRERRDIARNTVQTMIVRIEQKGWIEHRSIGRTFVYKSVQPRTTTLRQRLHDLMSTAGRGSAEALVTALLEDASLTKDAADRIRDMIDEAERRKKKKKGEPMMNHVPHLFAGSETMVFAARVLIQATLVIVLALLLGRWLRHQSALRHSVLLGGLMCVCFCPVATYLADRIDVPLISITWPSNPASHPHRTAPATSHQSASASSPVEAPNTLASLPPSVTAGQPAMSPDVLVLDSVPRQPAPEQVTGASGMVLLDEAPRVLSGSEITHGPVWMTVANIAGLIWLAGMAVISIRLLLAWRYLSRLRTSAVPLDEQGLPQLPQVSEEVLRAVAAKRLPPLLVSDRVKGPISLGVFRPAIVLPREMILTLNASQLRDVLIHETAHIHRHDHVIVLLQRLAGAFFWPFPLVWRLNTKIDEAREDVCDNYVLRHTEASQYSRTLLELTERAAKPQAIPLAIGLWKCPRKLEQRVAALLDPRRTTRTRLPRQTLCTLTVAFMSIAVLLAGSRFPRTSHAQAAEPQQPDGGEAKQQANEKEKKDARREAKQVAVPTRDQTDPYDALYDVIMTRYGKDGKTYAENETSPAIFEWSEFPFDDKTFDKFTAALDAFAALPQEKIEAYSEVKRALLQRHLWKVFDTTFNWDWPKDWYWGGRKSFPKTHMDRRTAVQPRIASLIRRLALTNKQILALPNPMAATVESGGFAQAHEPADRLKPFLPADLYSKESSWICVGEDRHAIPAATHTGKLHSRSMFLQFMRLPGGRAETLEYMERLKKKPEQFPVGTQFALIEQPFLVSKERELVLSPLIVSVQLRAYLDVGQRFRSSEDDAKATQCVAEFVMQPRELMKGNAVMRAMGPNDFRYEAGSPFAAGFSPRDPFATGDIAGRMPKTTRLNLCMSCHGDAGGRGIMTRSFRGTNFFFKESSAEDISKATSAQKRDDEEWKTLQKHWRSKSSPKDDDAKILDLPKRTAQAEQKKQREDKPVKVTEEQKARTALINRVETEVADELKNLHTAVLRAEVAKLSEMFKLEETEISRLRLAARGAANRAVEKTRDSLMAAVKKNVNYQLDKNDVDMTAVKFNGRYISLDAASNDQDSDDRNADENLYVTVKRRTSNIWFSVGFTYVSFSNTVGPQDSDVQDEEFWRKTISAVLTEEQLKQYTEHSKS